MATHKFNSVEDFLAFLPEDERLVTEVLRTMTQSTLPGATEKLSYNVPYYRIHTNICFIWPGSVLWGKKRSYDGVRFGFIKGYLLSDEAGYLDQGDRKEVYWRDFLHPQEINQELLGVYLQEAAILDEELAKSKKKK